MIRLIIHDLNAFGQRVGSSLLLVLACTALFAQVPLRQQVEADIRFLASDELLGRLPGTPTHDIAARYLASQFQALGLQPAPGQDSYFQMVPFERRFPAEVGSLAYKGEETPQGDQLVFLQGNALSTTAKAMYVGQGWVGDDQDDYAGKDVTGMIVVADMGAPGATGPGEIFNASRAKRAFAAERGAIALIEVYNLGIPFGLISNSLKNPTMSLKEETPEDESVNQALVHAWITTKGAPWLEVLKAGKTPKLALVCSGIRTEPVNAPNVLGVIPGQDSTLQNEYVLLTAHFDHVGAGQGRSGRPYTGDDSIYNGARDNAIGIAALLATASELSQRPPARSVICLAVTAEEMGLLGSQYYAEHPLIPLEKTVFNLNADGAGYDDTSSVMLIGDEHVTVQQELYRLEDNLPVAVIANQLPDMNLYGRSDQASFAQKGVPAVMLSPAIRSFNAQIQARYHTVTDGVESLNFDYVAHYALAFAAMSDYLANRSERPDWVEGDPFQEMGRMLYGE